MITLRARGLFSPYRPSLAPCHFRSTQTKISTLSNTLKTCFLSTPMALSQKQNVGRHFSTDIDRTTKATEIKTSANTTSDPPHSVFFDKDLGAVRQPIVASVRKVGRKKRGGYEALFALIAALGGAAYLYNNPSVSEYIDKLLGREIPLPNEADDEPEQAQEILKLQESDEISFLFLRKVWRSVQLLLLFQPLLLTSPLLYFFHNTRVEKWWWSALLWTLEAAGPCWIKGGQWISTRPDLFSEEFCQYVSSLHSDCPTHDFADTLKEITRVLGRPPQEVFRSIDPHPLASGAIAQVHVATLHDGTKVAIKVRHPRTRVSVLVDLSLMSSIVDVMNRIPGVQFLSLNDAKDQFRVNMLDQLNLAREAQNLVCFRKNFRKDTRIVFPKPYIKLSYPSVLVESYEEGRTVSQFFDSPDTEAKKKIADIGLNGYLKMMLVDHFIHADLHPGNVLVRGADPSAPHNDINKIQLVVLDAGLITQMTQEDSFKFVSLFRAVVEGDGEGGAALMYKYAREPPKWKTPQSEADYLHEMGAHFVKIRSKKLSEIEVGQFLASLMQTVRKYGVKLEGNFSTLMLGTIVLEGLGRTLNPEINLIESSVPFIVRNIGTVSQKPGTWDLAVSQMKRALGLHPR
ncbi:putative serine/threonine-protein kinase abkC-like [Planoprotostelium fungivorum]|uniref:Putative serine/threonine-protein kinase abkC-like n=1 Tax=Planoprotostelium fungivorum TaxID=1890364 RepID=A0A2P6P0Q4_9EUKA|nr:putative serine/threonine-protein kinase abkC-like [Planoprotostelium fungivorum]